MVGGIITPASNCPPVSSFLLSAIRKVGSRECKSEGQRWSDVLEVSSLQQLVLLHKLFFRHEVISTQADNLSTFESQTHQEIFRE